MDPVGKQFKVLWNSSNSNTHWILTLGSGKRLWRRLGPEFSIEEYGVAYSAICINGVLYFEGISQGSFVIVCFDVRSEKFSFINRDEDMLPNPFEHHSGATLFNYRDKLGIHFQVRQSLMLWVLEDAGTRKWSKHSYILSHLGSKIVARNWFLGMTSKGEIVYWSWKSCLFFYNIERNTFKRVNVQGLEGLEHPMILETFVDYVENMKFI